MPPDKNGGLRLNRGSLIPHLFVLSQKKAYILEHIKGIKSLDDCEVFCHYMEALVAYHRYMGGKD
jgi:hypothetical protein